MGTHRRIANLKAILKATRLQGKEYREKAQDFKRQLLAVVQKINAEPRLGHLSYCEVGRLYIEQGRYTILADMSKEVLTLSQELKTLKAQLANE